MKTSTFYLLFLLLFTACDLPSGETNQSGPPIPQDMDRATRLKFTQYWTQGRMLYKKRCINCHQNSGKGMEQLIPPLAGSDFLKNPAQVACIIRYGQQGKIVVNDTIYEGIMPANLDLTSLEIAELLTYIGNSWGNRRGFTPVKETAKWLEQCEQNQ